ncbi:MAG TPA: hypothetical protein VF337_04245 [Candidatus Limnocylindrales bacterium]
MAQDLPKAPAVQRQRRAQQGRVFACVPSVRVRVGNDQPDIDRLRRPPATRSDLARQSPLPVQRPEQLIHVDELRLELNDKQMPTLRVPEQLIDDTPLAPDRKRDLGHQIPAGRPANPARHALGEQRVSPVQQAVQVAATPPGDQVETHIQHRPNRADRTQ